MGLALLWTLVSLTVGILVAMRKLPIHNYFYVRRENVDISFKRLMELHDRKVSLPGIIRPYVIAREAGLDITVEQLITNNGLGGNNSRVITLLIKAKKAGLDPKEYNFYKISEADINNYGFMDTLEDYSVERLIRIRERNERDEL